MVLGLAGFFNGIHGLAAIFKKEYFSESSLLYQNLQVWGWVWLILGIHQISAAYMLFGRASGGRSLAIALAGVSAVVAFASLGAHPVGSILVIAMDVLVIYGLTVRADMFVEGGIDDSPIAPAPSPRASPSRDRRHVALDGSPPSITARSPPFRLRATDPSSVLRRRGLQVHSPWVRATRSAWTAARRGHAPPSPFVHSERGSAPRCRVLPCRLPGA